MKRLLSALALVSLALPSLYIKAASATPSPQLIAQGNSYYAGQAVGGQRVMVDLTSISRVGEYDANFAYSLDDVSIYSQAHCAGGGSWTTLDDGTMYHPQSQATRNMLNVVCSQLARMNEPAAIDVVSVFDPPSNIRTEPNGSILCAITTQSYINLIYTRRLVNGITQTPAVKWASSTALKFDSKDFLARLFSSQWGLHSETSAVS